MQKIRAACGRMGVLMRSLADQRPARLHTKTYSALAGAQRPMMVSDDVRHILDPDRNANVIGRGTSSALLISGQMLAGGGHRVNDHGLGITKSGQVVGPLDAVDEFGAGAALMPKPRISPYP